MNCIIKHYYCHLGQKEPQNTACERPSHFPPPCTLRIASPSLREESQQLLGKKLVTSPDMAIRTSGKRPTGPSHVFSPPTLEVNIATSWHVQKKLTTTWHQSHVPPVTIHVQSGHRSCSSHY